MSKYKPLPWQTPMLSDRRRVILMAGAAGGGKSRVAGEKMHAYMMKYPNATGLILRKTRESMVNSTLLSFESEVLGEGSGVRHLESKYRFEYSNGSILAYGGLKGEQQKESIRGVGKKGGIDIAWMEEATQFAEADFNEVLFRLRGRAAPWRQVLLTTNPGGPFHWINRRLIVGGGSVLYESKAADNTHNPTDYMDTMQRTSGVERQRLLLGRWANAENQVYEMWERTTHVTEDADYIEGGGVVHWGVDDGYVGEIDGDTGYFKKGSHPRVFLVAQLRKGILNIFAESYEVKMKQEKHIAQVLELGYPRPEWAAVDSSSASLRGDMHDGQWGEHRWSLDTKGKPPRVAESISEMRDWLLPDKNDVVRLQVHPRCRNFIMEMETYSNKESTGEPDKEFDHGPDAARYLVWPLRWGQ